MTGAGDRPDRRRWPSNGRVAARSLGDRAGDARPVDPQPCRVTVPVADLLAAPAGKRDRQVLFGEVLEVLERGQGHAFVVARKDGYVGYVDDAALTPLDGPDPATHQVRAAASHLYPAPDIKVKETALLSLGARLRVSGTEGAFARVEQGYVIARHLAPLTTHEADPVAVAERLLGTPYLWGGNSREGIDCSGLVQIACDACGIPCPGDSDMQAAELGDPLDPGADLRRCDLVFWKGHVAWVSGPDRILHANGHDMAVAFEGLSAAIARIEAQGEGPVTGLRRLNLPV